MLLPAGVSHVRGELALAQLNLHVPKKKTPIPPKIVPFPPEMQDEDSERPREADLESVWGYTEKKKDGRRQGNGKSKTSYKELRTPPPKYMWTPVDYVCNYCYKCVPFLSQGSFSSYDITDENDPFKYPTVINSNNVDDLIDNEVQQRLTLPSPSYQSCADDVYDDDPDVISEVISSSVDFIGKVFTHKRSLEIFPYPKYTKAQIDYKRLRLTNSFLILAIRNSRALHERNLLMKGLKVFMKFIQKAPLNPNLKHQLYCDEVVVRFIEASLELHRTINTSISLSYSHSLISFNHFVYTYDIIIDDLIEDAAKEFCAQIDSGGCFLQELLQYQSLLMCLIPHKSLDFLDDLSDYVVNRLVNERSVYTFCLPYNTTEELFGVYGIVEENLQVVVKYEKCTWFVKECSIFPMFGLYSMKMRLYDENKFPW